MRPLFRTTDVFHFRQALLQLNAIHNLSPSLCGSNAQPQFFRPCQVNLSSRASAFRAARDLGEPREASRFLRRSNRAFGSLPL
jgi:hypothetical protein